MATRGLCREVDLRSSQRPVGVPSSTRSIQRPFMTCNVPSKPSIAGLRSVAPALVPRRSASVCKSAAVVDAAPATPVPALASLPLCSVINTQGLVFPELPAGTKGAIYAIYDEKQKMQYVGQTTDLRNALRLCLGRRPEKTFYYKCFSFPTGDAAVLQLARDAWFSECGGQPNGNRLAVERTMWQQPVDAFAISERGRKGAAEAMAILLQDTLKARGCKEEFVPNLALLADGQVEFLPALDMSDDEIAAEREAESARMRGRRSCTCMVDGQERIFHTSYPLKFSTAGGFLLDVSVLFDGRETQHRVIVGKSYYEPFGISPESAAEAGLALLLRAKVARSTEGMLLSSQFPVNYFALGQVEQWYGEEFRNEFDRITGGVQLGDGNADGWRFNRIHDYGAMRNETADQLNSALGSAEATVSKAAVERAIQGRAPLKADEEDDDLPQGRGLLDKFFP